MLIPVFSRVSNMLQDKSFQFCLSAGIVSLLVGGTFAAKSVFLVDNDVEATTEFATKNWYLDAESIQKYPQNIEKLAFNYIDRISKLPENKAWCGIDREISLVLAKAKSLNLLEVNNFDRGKADIVIKLLQSRICACMSIAPNHSQNRREKPLFQSRNRKLGVLLAA
jgi:hypothetical protein